MAFFPCDHGKHRHRGRNHHAYFALASFLDVKRWHLRLCSGHFAEVQEYLTQFEVDPESTAVSVNGTHSTCLACLKPADEGGWQFFATCYPPEDERKDYWGKLHLDCRLPVTMLDS